MESLLLRYLKYLSTPCTSMCQLHETLVTLSESQLCVKGFGANQLVIVNIYLRKAQNVISSLRCSLALWRSLFSPMFRCFVYLCLSIHPGRGNFALLSLNLAALYHLSWVGCSSFKSSEKNYLRDKLTFERRPSWQNEASYVGVSLMKSIRLKLSCPCFVIVGGNIRQEA